MWKSFNLATAVADLHARGTPVVDICQDTPAFAAAMAAVDDEVRLALLAVAFVNDEPHAIEHARSTHAPLLPAAYAIACRDQLAFWQERVASASPPLPQGPDPQRWRAALADWMDEMNRAFMAASGAAEEAAERPA